MQDRTERHLERRPRPSTAAVLLVALWTATASALIAWTASPPGTALPLGAAVLGGTAVLRSVVRTARLTAGLGGLGAAIVLVNLVPSGRLLHPSSAVVGAARWVEVAACLGALVAAVVLLARRPGRSQEGDREHPDARAADAAARAGQVTVLVVLSAICAELLAAYNDDTGRPAALLGAIVFFAGLYGAPALLMREIVRRTGRGWPALLLLAAAFGLAQAGLLDQSVFAEDYGDVQGWEESMRPTRLDVLGLSAYPTASFLVGHVIYSFGAPIAVVEAMRPATARSPWLGRTGLTAAVLAYLATGSVIFFDVLGTPAGGSAAELAVTAAAVVALVAAAFAVRPGTAGSPDPAGPTDPAGPAGPTDLADPAGPGRRAPGVWVVLAGGLLLGLAENMLPQTWAGLAGLAGLLAGAAALLLRGGRLPGWGPAQAAAVATGWILARGLLAFTYFPVVGEVAPLPKYAHNVVMLIVVCAAGGYALRRSRPALSPVPPTGRR